MMITITRSKCYVVGPCTERYSDTGLTSYRHFAVWLHYRPLLSRQLRLVDILCTGLIASNVKNTARYM